MPTTAVLQSTMVHRELGTGVPIVFLHGNPTSSYLWRNVLPAVGAGRRLAPDLIGMGESGKPDLEYTFDDHARYLDAWFDALNLEEVVLVGHDWGGALAFDWAARNPGRVRGLAFLETIVKPMAWEEFPEDGRALFRSIKTPGAGEALILDDNAFLTQLLPYSVARPRRRGSQGLSGAVPDAGKPPAAAAMGAVHASRRRTRRGRRPHRAVRHLAGRQPGRAEAIARLPTGAGNDDGTAAARLVRPEHRGAGDRTPRLRRAPRT